MAQRPRHAADDAIVDIGRENQRTTWQNLGTSPRKKNASASTHFVRRDTNRVGDSAHPIYGVNRSAAAPTFSYRG